MDFAENFCKFTQDVGELVTRRAPEILAGLGIASFVTGTVEAVRVTPTAYKMIEERKKELNVDKLNAKEKVKTAGKLYIFPISFELIGSCLICKSVNVNTKRVLVATEGLELWRNFATTYSEKTKDIVGKNKEERIRDAVNQERIDNNIPVQNVNIYAPKEDGTYRCLFYEPITNRYFWERREKVEMAIAKAYKEIDNSFEESLSVYTWLTLLPKELSEGLHEGALDKYMDMGWSRTSPYDGLTIDIKSGGVVHGGEYDGYPCLVLDYSELPAPYFKSPY